MQDLNKFYVSYRKDLKYRHSFKDYNYFNGWEGFKSYWSRPGDGKMVDEFNKKIHWPGDAEICQVAAFAPSCVLNQISLFDRPDWF